MIHLSIPAPHSSNGAWNRIRSRHRSLSRVRLPESEAPCTAVPSTTSHPNLHLFSQPISCHPHSPPTHLHFPRPQKRHFAAPPNPSARSRPASGRSLDTPGLGFLRPPCPPLSSALRIPSSQSSASDWQTLGHSAVARRQPSLAVAAHVGMRLLLRKSGDSERARAHGEQHRASGENYRGWGVHFVFANTAVSHTIAIDTWKRRVHGRQSGV